MALPTSPQAAIAHANSTASKQQDAIAEELEALTIGEQSRSAAAEDRNMALSNSAATIQATTITTLTKTCPADTAMPDTETLDSRILDTAKVDSIHTTIAEVLQAPPPRNSGQAIPNSQLEMKKRAARCRRDHKGGILKIGSQARKEEKKVRFE